MDLNHYKKNIRAHRQGVILHQVMFLEPHEQNLFQKKMKACCLWGFKMRIGRCCETPTDLSNYCIVTCIITM